MIVTEKIALIALGLDLEKSVHQTWVMEDP